MRVKGGTVTKRKHKKVLTAVKGMRDMRKRSIRRAKEALLKSGANAYVGRKRKKRDFRALWNIRISAATKKFGLSYSKFIGNLKTKNIELDRKVLAEIAAEKPAIFEKIVEESKK
jgi:large subunit ribosomal protein L20